MGSLVDRKIGYGIVQPGQNILHGVPVIKVNNLIDGLHSKGELDVTTKENDEKYSRTRLEGGELIVSVVGTVGKTAIVPKSFRGCNLVRAVAMIDIKENWLSRWVKYYIDSPAGQAYIEQNLNTTVQATLNIKTLVDMPIPFLKEDEMRKIVTILEAIDRKIECNQQINDNLLWQAQALYKDRFIDLKPFNGKMPPDWQLGTVSEIIELHDSKRIPLSSRERANLTKIYPYYGATSVMDYVDRYLFDGIYLLLGEDGTVVDDKGFPILQYVEGKFWVNNHAHIITGKNGFTVETLYLLFSLTNVRSIVTGAVQPKISQANLNNVSVVIPSKAELSTFNSIVQPIFSQIRNLRAESDRLTSTRDILLPRLMSGEIDAANIQL